MPLTPDLPFPKSAGNPIRSKDWNDLVTETQRLDNAKVNRSGDAITGPLSISAALSVAQRAVVGPVATPSTGIVGRLEVSGSAAEVSFVRRELAAWPSPPTAGDRFVWYNSNKVMRLFTEGVGDMLAIDSAGRLGVGTTSPNYILDVAGRVRVRQQADGATAGIWFSDYGLSERAFVGLSSGTEVGFWGNTGSAGWRLVVNTTTGNLNVSANAFKPGGGSWGNSSDARLKQNIKPLEGALERLLRLRGATYEWIDPASQGNLTGQQLGFIAQEVEPVFPEWVGEDNKGFKTLSIRGFEALTVEALRELQRECAGLRRELDALRARVEPPRVPVGPAKPTGARSSRSEDKS